MVKSSFKVDFDSKKVIKEMTKQTKKNLMKQSYEINCPKCNHSFKTVPGMTTCPECNATIDFNLQIDL